MGGASRKGVGLSWRHDCTRHAFVVGLLSAMPWTTLAAQPIETNQTIDPSRYQALEFRMVGPERGGRVTAVTGVRGEVHTFYMGATGGGVWKTTDAGNTWTNLSDGYFGVGSIGALAVAESNANIVYAGTGEACIRGNVSIGNGVYKSTDAGESWRHIGLDDVGQIGSIVVHPANPALVYVAALGNPFGRNAARGVYRSSDGGQSWEHVLSLSDSTGAVDLAMDQTDPRVVYAAMWRAERKPWTLISGGKEGGLYKTADGGDSWLELTNGLPETTGRIGVTVSPLNPRRVWALVEAFRGEAGLYHSEDAGQSWRLINTSEYLIERPWYYNHVFADPQDENTIYVASEAFWRSLDGGLTFERVRTRHGDNHDLWINPDDNRILIEGNDGGAIISFNVGETWSPQLNQPTAEFYSVEVDDDFPYRLYGPQQDNTSISVPSRTTGAGGIGTPIRDWEIWGCETGGIALDPRDSNVIYTACFGDGLTRFDRTTHQTRQIGAYPQASRSRPVDVRYRFQWNMPVLVSRHHAGVLYLGSQYLHRSVNDGQSWEVISPDLTRNDSTKQTWAGEPITRDMTSVEVYPTVFEITESPLDPDALWVGSNDGLIHVSRDRGRTWQNVTPPQLPEWSTVAVIEASPHAPGRAFVAAYRYRMADFRPYVFRTDDYGESWTLLTDSNNGIPDTHPVRVVREDPDRRGLLYVGTEFGLFVSFDDGAHWQSLQLNLPHTPVMDLKVHRQDLVVATQGRSFWILDDVTPLHQLTPNATQPRAFLFQPRGTYRSAAFREPPNRALIFYEFAETPSRPVTLEVLDGEGRVIRSYSSGTEGEDSLPAQAGMNRFVWDLRYPATGGEIVRRNGPLAVPGTYAVRLSMGEWSQTQSFDVLKDPRLATTLADFQAQFDLLTRIGARLENVNDVAGAIRDLKAQLEDRVRGLRDDGAETIEVRASAVLDRLSDLEAEVILVPRGPVMGHAPRKLDGQLNFLASYVSRADARPTDQDIERFRELEGMLLERVAALEAIIETGVAALNDLLEAEGLVPIRVAVPAGARVPSRPPRNP